MISPLWFPPPLASFPVDVATRLCEYFNFSDYSGMKKVCRRWRDWVGDKNVISFNMSPFPAKVNEAPWIVTDFPYRGAGYQSRYGRKMAWEKYYDGKLWGREEAHSIAENFRLYTLDLTTGEFKPVLKLIYAWRNAKIKFIDEYLVLFALEKIQFYDLDEERIVRKMNFDEGYREIGDIYFDRERDIIYALLFSCGSSYLSVIVQGERKYNLRTWKHNYNCNSDSSVFRFDMDENLTLRACYERSQDRYIYEREIKFRSLDPPTIAETVVSKRTPYEKKDFVRTFQLFFKNYGVTDIQLPLEAIPKLFIKMEKNRPKFPKQDVIFGIKNLIPGEYIYIGARYFQKNRTEWRKLKSYVKYVPEEDEIEGYVSPDESSFDQGDGVMGCKTSRAIDNEDEDASSDEDHYL